MYLNNSKACILKDICCPTFIAVVFMPAKTWRRPKCLRQRSRWRRCGIYVYTMQSHSATRKDEILPFETTWMHLVNSYWVKPVSHKKLRTIWLHSFVGYKTEACGPTHTAWWGLPGGRGWEMGRWRGPSIWWQKMVWLWVVGTQWSIQISYHRNTHLNAIWSC